MQPSANQVRVRRNNRKNYRHPNPRQGGSTKASSLSCWWKNRGSWTQAWEGSFVGEWIPWGVQNCLRYSAQSPFSSLTIRSVTSFSKNRSRSVEEVTFFLLEERTRGNQSFCFTDYGRNVSWHKFSAERATQDLGTCTQWEYLNFSSNKWNMRHSDWSRKDTFLTKFI